ncbi:hypothetical protein [Pyxidicoccus sp. MSG2]|uniref:hypothetical protein n=1 Tax=Pyxidicoccus sp. MSG2 TaxID=2996790 RepID=UPI0022710267|nr:hypothetical protein [Pyxidicoccus sp. MSG2]MCY1021710.1 hypothetical protein [Pyxidicoccus sp. MSG2]
MKFKVTDQAEAKKVELEEIDNDVLKTVYAGLLESADEVEADWLEIGGYAKWSKA